MCTESAGYLGRNQTTVSTSDRYHEVAKERWPGRKKKLKEGRSDPITMIEDNYNLQTSESSLTQHSDLTFESPDTFTIQVCPTRRYVLDYTR